MFFGIYDLETDEKIGGLGLLGPIDKSYIIQITSVLRTDRPVQSSLKKIILLFRRVRMKIKDKE